MCLDAELAESHIGTGVRMKKLRVCRCCSGILYLHYLSLEVMRTQRQDVLGLLEQKILTRVERRAKNVGGDKLQRCRLRKGMNRMQQQRHDK